MGLAQARHSSFFSLNFEFQRISVLPGIRQRKRRRKSKLEFIINRSNKRSHFPSSIAGPYPPSGGPQNDLSLPFYRPHHPKYRSEKTRLLLWGRHGFSFSSTFFHYLFQDWFSKHNFGPKNRKPITSDTVVTTSS